MKLDYVSHYGGFKPKDVSRPGHYESNKMPNLPEVRERVQLRKQTMTSVANESGKIKGGSFDPGIRAAQSAASLARKKYEEVKKRGLVK